MEQIVNNAFENPEIFVSVEQQLDEITQSVNKSINHNIKRVTEGYEGKQKLEKARLTVQHEINRHFAGKDIPKILVSLLDAGWQHLLVINKLSENDNNVGFQNYLRPIYNLNAWLSGTDKATEEQASTTLDFIETQLQTVCTNTFLQQKILRELNALLSNELQTAEMIFFEAKPTTTVSRPRYLNDEVDQLRVGEWLTFLLNDEFEPLKLVWIGEIDDIFVFVNRHGLKKLELSHAALSEFIKNGTANRIESLDMPIMDRATHKMLQKMHKKLVYNGTHDPVTDLFNRKEFTKLLKGELIKFDQSQHVLCNIEILDFRTIVNACGLTGGDALLLQLATLLKNQLRKNEVIARFGDKTFSILFKNCPAQAADEIANKLLSLFLNHHFEWGNKSYATAVSIGLVPFYNNGINLSGLLQQVDTVTLTAKNAGRNRFRIYTDEDQSLKIEHRFHDWAGRIDHILSNDRLFLRCQKIAAINPQHNKEGHYEILLGVLDENDKVIAPDDFIPAVERCRRMSEIDRWVVQTTFNWIAQHQELFATLDGFSINLSGESLNSEEFLNFLQQTLASCNLPLDKITFEITETVAAGSFTFTQQFIKAIKRFNCKFSLDDFGSGFSSYAYLKNLNVDYLKIDGAFVKDILNNQFDIAIVKSINEIAHSLGLETIAEYVENSEIHELLKEIGIDYAQGWGIQKPIRLNELSTIQTT